jgi:dTDP-4-dehydrorhamnose 3,5-epimerase
MAPTTAATTTAEAPTTTAEAPTTAAAPPPDPLTDILLLDALEVIDTRSRRTRPTIACPLATEPRHNRGVRFVATPLSGVLILEIEPHRDERGFFARTYCEQEFGARGLHARYPQANVSYNARAHTLRGMHWQAPPHGEVKLVRCTAGAIWDVVVDLRPGPGRFAWFGVELSARARNQLYIPDGFAHGFLTLADDTEVAYQMGAPYVAGAARGMRWDDPRVGIRWPKPPAVISERDRSYPDFRDDLGDD